MFAQRIRAVISIHGMNNSIVFPIHRMINTVTTAKKIRSAMESNRAPNSLCVFVLRAIYPSNASLNPQIKYKTKNSTVLWNEKHNKSEKMILHTEIILAMYFNSGPPVLFI